MDTKVHYTLVGIFVVALTFAIFVVILWLSTAKHGQVYDTYVTYLAEEVSGLSTQSLVRFNGVKVGYVESVTLKKDDPQKVSVVMKILQQTPITKSTVAMLMSEGITGISYIGLKALSPDAPILVAGPDEMPVIPSELSFFAKISKSAGNTLESVNALSNDLRKVFDKTNRAAIHALLGNLVVVTHDMSPAIKNLDHTLLVLTQTAKNISETTTLMGMMMQNQVMPPLEVFMWRLNDLTSHLQRFSNELQRNPAIVFRGKAPTPPGPGERR